MSQLARAIVLGNPAKIAAAPTPTPRLTTAIVGTVNDDGTADVQIDGSSSTTTAYTLATAPVSDGDTAVAAVCGSQVFVLGTLGSAPAASGVELATGTVTSVNASSATATVTTTSGSVIAVDLTDSAVVVGDTVLVITSSGWSSWYVVGVVGSAPDAGLTLHGVMVGVLPATGVPVQEHVGVWSGTPTSGTNIAYANVDLTSLGLAYGYTAEVSSADSGTGGTLGLVLPNKSQCSLTQLQIAFYGNSGSKWTGLNGTPTAIWRIVGA